MVNVAHSLNHRNSSGHVGTKSVCTLKYHPKYKNKKLTFELLLIIQKNCDKIQKITVI